MPSFISERLHRFREGSAGNVTMIFALGAPFLCFAIAIAVDFTDATIVKSKLNAAADAAALAALTPAMLQLGDSDASLAAVNMFNARVAAMGSMVKSVSLSPPIITHPNGNQTIRQVEIDYSAQANTIFSGVLGQNSMNIGGSSTAVAAVPPNIDFYLLLDNSPSMSLPATADGITQMVNLTPKQGGCAFACHQASTNNGDTAGNLCVTNTSPPIYSTPTQSSNTYCASKDSQGRALTQLDNYAMARYNNIPLRLDELTGGITTLMKTANDWHTSGVYTTPPSYRFAAYSMNSLWQIGTTNTLLMALTSDYQNAWTTASTKFGVMQMFSNNNVCANSSCSSAGGVGDVETNFDNAMGSINTTMPVPGNGTNIPGDKPQEVMFLITDGVEDEATTTCTQPLTGNRCQAPINPSLCTTIKNRGIKIGVLYTEYLAVTSNSWYNSWIAPFQPTIGAQLQACASPGLYVKYSIGDDFGSALNTLFQAAVQSASLSK